MGHGIPKKKRDCHLQRGDRGPGYPDPYTILPCTMLDMDCDFRSMAWVQVKAFADVKGPVIQQI